MERQARYSRVDKYVIKAVCQEPLHVGSSNGDKEEVLTHPVDNIPFIQAASLAGVFRDYYHRVYGKEYTERIFGKAASLEEGEQGSRIRFTDGSFNMDTVRMELRPRVKLNAETGTAAAEEKKGCAPESGQKFEMQYVGAGAEFSFTVYLFEDDASFHEGFLKCLSAIQAGTVQFGGQKSNGCGYLKLLQVLYSSFDLRKEEERKKWFHEYDEEEQSYQIIELSKLPETEGNRAFDVWLYGKTESELLVKGTAVTDCGENVSVDMNIQNGRKDYIIPASSLKGAIRNRIQMITRYKNLNQELISQMFGKAASEEEEGNTGLFCFYDTVIGEKADNDKADIRMRIRIDKFTGGVVNGGLFSQKNTAGRLNMHVSILNGEAANAACALLVLALRDMAIGEVTIGSGYSIGKGFIQADKIVIANSRKEPCVIDFLKGTVQDEYEILSSCLQALKKQGGN